MTEANQLGGSHATPRDPTAGRGATGRGADSVVTTPACCITRTATSKCDLWAHKLTGNNAGVLSPRMPDLSALEVLVAVSRTGSLGAAAREVGRTQQAVSSRIAAVEAQTGVPLVTRGPTGSVLTPSGLVVAEWASRLLDQAAEVDAGLAALRADVRGRVRVAASLSVAERLVPRWLVALRGSGAGPEVVVDAVNSAEVAGLVREGRADVGFVEGPVAPRGCRSQVVGHAELQLVVAPDHPWAARNRPVEARLLAATPLVTRERGPARETRSRRRCGATGPGRRDRAAPAGAVHHGRDPHRRRCRRRAGRAQRPRRLRRPGRRAAVPRRRARGGAEPRVPRGLDRGADTARGPTRDLSRSPPPHGGYSDCDLGDHPLAEDLERA